jgi:UDP-N-acetylglucosamine 1-carboxyvinyltransferase
MTELGATVDIEHGYVVAHCSRLRGKRTSLLGPAGSSVGATINVMMAAALAEGTTVIEGAALEPEVSDVASFLRAMGARIEGDGTPFITIEGVEELHGAEYAIIPDRIETGTLAIAASITGGEISMKGCRPDHLRAVLTLLRQAGVTVEEDGDSLTISAGGELRPVDVKVAPYPGFPTDMQAQMTALMCVTPGTSVISERIFENRFLHVSELTRLGADIRIDGSSAIVRGVEKLSGAFVMASDLRASAALVLAGLVAEGETVVRRVYHLDRGYELFDRKLAGLGAEIRREEE